MRIFILVTVALSFIIELNAAADNLPLQTSKDVGVQNLDSHHIEHRSDNTSAAEYIVWPKDGSNKDAVAKISDLLKQLTQNPTIYSYTDYKGNLMHWILNATDSQVQSIQGSDGVARVEQNTIIAEEFASVPVPTEIAELSEARKVKRDTQYSTQQDAVWELKMISQPTTVPNLNDLENYVYEAEGGKGIYVYHIERGINTDLTDEFPADRVEVVQTPLSVERGQLPNQDGSPVGHGTGTASKAVGVKYGSAKASNLVVIKMGGYDRGEITEVFDFVLKHITQNQRGGKAVVSISWGSSDVTDPNNLDPDWQKAKDAIIQILDNDVPVFISAVNSANQYVGGKRRFNVDTAPAIFEGDDCPIVVVGNSDNTGRRYTTSQGGPHVQVLAPGKDITAQDFRRNAPIVKTGTSFSAPLMAGMVATYLASNGIPADPGKLAAAVKQYLQDHANWQQIVPIKVVWNEVDEVHNPKRADAASAATSLATTGPAPLPTSQTSGPPPATVPYAQGVCGIHVKQTTVAGDPGGEYDLEVLMTDNRKAQIGYNQPIQANASHPLEFQSKLEDVLVCVPESQHDYIAFALGAQQWPSNGNFAPGAIPRCSVGGWDGDTLRTRQMDCTFSCMWGGGKSSDGTD